ncbi:putative transposase [Phytophthora cinnamomi]|uniref:putative transposase n=1 Tax=Phytophthora cinnamomi TaxID=4785 RepID=UPI00355A6217|nr:putative transposase [Phytophthora cinnamomi]
MASRVFVDETSKDARSVLRKYGWSAWNTPANATLPFNRGNRVSVLAVLDVTGFFCVGSRGRHPHQAEVP